MPTIIVQGRPVPVSDNFFNLSPEEQSSRKCCHALQLPERSISDAYLVPEDSNIQIRLSSSGEYAIDDADEVVQKSH